MNEPVNFFLIDDDEDDVMLFKEVASDCNTPVHFISALSGNEALEMLGELHPKLPDVLFLDLNMPRMDGKECLAKIKQDPLLAQIPVVMYTTSSQQNDIDETFKLGAAGFITKPSDVKELIHILTIIAENCPHNLLEAIQSLSHNAKCYRQILDPAYSRFFTRSG